MTKLLSNSAVHWERANTWNVRCLSYLMAFHHPGQLLVDQGPCRGSGEAQTSGNLVHKVNMFPRGPSIFFTFLPFSLPVPDDETHETGQHFPEPLWLLNAYTIHSSCPYMLQRACWQPSVSPLMLVATSCNIHYRLLHCTCLYSTEIGWSILYMDTALMGCLY